MLRSLVIALAAVFLQIAPLSPQAQGQPADHPKTAKPHQQPEPQPPLVTNIDNRVTCDECDKEQTVPPKNPDKYTVWGFRINLLLTVITLVIALASLKQADAANKQASHIVASERAWILVDTGEIPDDFEPDPSTVQIMDIRPVVRNFGKTPARIIRVSLRTHQVAKGEQLPAEPDYKNITETEITLPPTVPLQPMGTMISLSDFIPIRLGTVVLYVYGFVDYLDFAEQERRSAFCFVYLLGGGFTSMKRSFYIATQVPKIYRRNT